MENTKWSEKVTKEKVLEVIGEKKTLTNNIHAEKSIELIMF